MSRSNIVYELTLTNADIRPNQFLLLIIECDLVSLYRITQPNFDYIVDLTTSMYFISSKLNHWYKMYGGGRI